MLERGLPGFIFCPSPIYVFCMYSLILAASVFASGDPIVPTGGFVVVPQAVALRSENVMMARATFGVNPYYEADDRELKATRWGRAPFQTGWGILGSLLGAGVGSGLGGLVGSVVEEEWLGSSSEAGVVGAGIGLVAGASFGTGFAVHKSASDVWASKGMMLPIATALVGYGVGAGVAYGVDSDFEDAPGELYLGAWLTGVVGAVVVDRLTADAPVRYSVAPWFPQAGSGGVRVSLEY